ncbi:MAG: hypothetical protein M3Z31_19030 [Pseudomonadota bacterium]|nr:hypothetical protein [Pseudomonadota bacterium]
MTDNASRSGMQVGVAGTSGTETLWFAPRAAMWPLAARECWVRNPLNGAVARLNADEYAFLSACSGARSAAEHEAQIIARLNVPWTSRAAVRRFVERARELQLLLPLHALVDLCEGGAELPEASCRIVVRTADRPELLARLLDEARALEKLTGVSREWHVLDDSRGEGARLRNREIARACALHCTVHDLAVAQPFVQDLRAAHPGAQREIDWLLGEHNGAATYGRPVNLALLRFAGQRWIAIDDDASLRPRACPVPLPGFAVSSANDELFAFESDQALADACAEVDTDIIAEHERWLGLPIAHAWSAALHAHGEPAVDLQHEDALRFGAGARILFTQNAAVGDPGSSLFPYHVLGLPPASLAHIAVSSQRQDAALVHRHDWRGMQRFRLSPRRLLTFTTVAGIDNRELLPPTSPIHRNEDLLLGEMSLAVRPRAWFADLALGLPHRRAAAKQWLGPGTQFAQEPLHILLDMLEQRASQVTALDPSDRLQTLASLLTDLANAGERELHERIEAQAIDTATRVLFAVRGQLDDASAPPGWKTALRPWLASPALAIAGPELTTRLAPAAQIRTLARDYGAALAVWPSLWQHCRAANV